MCTEKGSSKDVILPIGSLPHQWHFFSNFQVQQIWSPAFFWTYILLPRLFKLLFGNFRQITERVYMPMKGLKEAKLEIPFHKWGIDLKGLINACWNQYSIKKITRKGTTSQMMKDFYHRNKIYTGRNNSLAPVRFPLLYLNVKETQPLIVIRHFRLGVTEKKNSWKMPERLQTAINMLIRCTQITLWTTPRLPKANGLHYSSNL